MKRWPPAYVASLIVLAVIGVLVTLTMLAIPPFDNLQVFILFNVIGFFALLVLGVVGGAFVGLLLAQKLIANRQFTEFERTLLQGIEDVRERLDSLEKRLEKR